MPKPMLTTVNLEYNFPSAGYYVIDLMRGLSLINRKSYRSGMVLSVDNFEYVATSNAAVYLYKIPETYMSLRAWQMGFELWKAQRFEAMDNNEIGPGKWSDFKVFYNEAHRTLEWEEQVPVVPNIAVGPAVSTADIDISGSEWNRAELIIRQDNLVEPETRYLGMLGAENTAGTVLYGGLIQAWADTRASTMAPDPNIPATASTSWVMRSGAEPSEMVEDVLDLVEGENDNPPYANTIDPLDTAIILGGSETGSAGIMHDRATVGSTGRPLLLQGGLFPLGLIAVRCDVDGGTLRVNVSRGDMKGVAALPMGDFN